MSKCAVCNKGIYPMDPKISLDGSIYHATCAKCSECSCQITLANFTKVEGGLMCKTHYMKNFKESGGRYVSKALTTSVDSKPMPLPAANTSAFAISAGTPAKPASSDVSSAQNSTPSIIRPAVLSASILKDQLSVDSRSPVPSPVSVARANAEEEESTPTVEAEPVSSQFLEEPSPAEDEAQSAPAVMSEEEFAAVFESGASLSAPPPPKPSASPVEVNEEEAVAPPKRSSTRINSTQAEISSVTPSRRTKHAIPRPSNDFSDLDYDILTVKTNLVYGYEGEYDAEGRKCGRGIYKYPGNRLFPLIAANLKSSSDGNVYEGTFRDNMRHGYGILRYPNGDVYEGEWNLGRKEGKARFIFADSGEIYEGTVNIMIWNEALELADYIGMWMNDRRHGQGKYMYPDGSVYEGRYVVLS